MWGDKVVCRMFLFPTLVILFFLIVYPFVMLIYNSFFNFSVLRPNIPAKFVGIANYQFYLTDEYTWQRFIFTGKFVVVAVAVQLFLGVGVAYLFQRKFKGQDIIFTLILMPMMLSPVVVGLFWKYLFNSQWGLVSYLISTLTGLKIEWLNNARYSFWAVVVADTWMWTPFMILLATAAFKGVPKALYEAAAVDGASAGFRFFNITLPLSAPILLIAVLLRFIDSMKQFDLFFALTGGGPGDSTQTISFTIYKNAFQYFYTGESSALSLILLIVIIGLALIFVKYLTSLSAKRKA